ncbi:MAG: glycosyltransferase family 1 protein [Candidatus Andersenbacteria bacterium CG10_big_fil_rev_8_21_14_0_10_54_11]|uniref:Glycosyltransferase family 1 protein n=1 Tax=Candidatus Andersenbacteria bacterium CG10_big_fil_rev_8_21_14_0_10_54_11 TaxID=1974485 RepID=A0A2M6WZJ9_9BACT|nr:MAG: glycosyltransferase family 1 protein [Candidatus Andersenbacteria bacterium CG10_big_fil_rev_8_21_14_0_10_54_11]
MRIAIDARAWEWAGIGRYIRNLLSEYARLEHPYVFEVLVGSRTEEAAVHALGDNRLTTRLVEPSYYSWREQVLFRRQLAGLSVDLVHFTHFNVPLFYSGPSVVTIHDVTRFYFPGQRVPQELLRQVFYEQVFAHAVRRARQVICVSETTCLALAALPLRISRQPVVIPEGVAERFFAAPAAERQQVRARLGFDGPYVLSVGVWMGHKNLRRTLAAFTAVRRVRPDVRLVITGRAQPRYVNVPAKAAQLQIPEEAIVYPGFISDELLPAMYAEAAVLLFPSLYEGFGLPALEALAAGIPVVAAQAGSLPEVLDGAAFLVNPEYEPGIARAVLQVLAGDGDLEGLRAAGRERARRFSWKECARRTLHVYDEVLRGRKKR